MSNIQVLGDLELSGALSFSKNLGDFPANPAPRSIVVKEGVPYIYTELVNGSGFMSWQPIGLKQASYLHTQGVASTVWTISHNFNTSDFAYFVYDSNHNLVVANIEIIDANTCRINLSSAITGTVVLFSLQYMNSTTVSASQQLNLGTSTVTTSAGELKVNNNAVAFKEYVDAQDSALSTRIDNVLANVDPAAIDSISELLTAFQAADGDLSASLTGLSSSTTAAIAIERTRALGAEAALVASKADKATTLAGYGITDAVSTNGEAGSAAKLANIRTIGITGDATWSTSFDGSANVSSALTLANSGVTAGTYGSATQVVPFTVDAKGRITNAGAAVTITPAFSSITGKPTTLAGYGITDAVSTTGSAGSAAKLATARTISIGGDASWSTSFDGSANVAGSMTLANSGVIAGTYKSVTVDAKGRVTGGTNPTTIAGYGITDDTRLFPVASVMFTNVDTSGNPTGGTVDGVNLSGAFWEIPYSATWNWASTYWLLLNQTNPNDNGLWEARSNDVSGGYTTHGRWIKVSPVNAIIYATGGSNKGATYNYTVASGFVPVTNLIGTGLVKSAAGVVSLATSGATTGTYKSVTVDTYGRVTAGSNPTTVAGFGISDVYTKTETDSRIQDVVGAAPAALDTLVEIAAQLANDESAAAALTSVVATKATVSYVDSEIANLAASVTVLSASATTDLATEISDRTIADVVLQTNIDAKADQATTYTKAEVDALIAAAIDAFAETLYV